MPISINTEFIPFNLNTPVSDTIYIKGGYSSVATVAARNAINDNFRKIGMLVHVQADNATYILLGGITNSDWQPFTALATNFATGFVSVTGVVFPHNLGYYPNVQLIDNSGAILVGRIQHNSLTSTSVYFNKTYSGSGYLS
jgi:hypothetical protein